MKEKTDAQWRPDEFAQPEADYSGEGNVNRARKRSGKPSPEAKAAQLRRWRARHRSHSRDYMRRYMAQRRAAAKAVASDGD